MSWQKRTRSFTFHYASTLSEIGSRGGVHFHNLHSTMLLLYPTANLFACNSYFIYIPLCFYFILADAGILQQTISIYIPLCFYFILPRFSGSLPESRIYIPLCFYFIEVECEDLKPQEINLHSTMLLLYRYLSAWMRATRSNLHSTMLLLYLIPTAAFIRDFSIYIPLCFYFIVGVDTTQTEFNSDLHSTMLLLYRYTFFIAMTTDLYLHSTMLLLYRPYIKTKSSACSIYIPLCFYFIENALKKTI